MQQGETQREKTRQKTCSADGTDVTNAWCLGASEVFVSPFVQTSRAIRGMEGGKKAENTVKGTILECHSSRSSCCST